MRKKQHKWREIGKNILIAVLVCSAIYLALRTQLQSQTIGANLLGNVGSFLGLDAKPINQGELVPLRAAAWPVRIAVNTADGRYGVQYDTAVTNEAFERVGNLLAEALGGAAQSVQVSETSWQKALGSVGIYFDFLGQVPLTALHVWLSGTEETILSAASVRRILLAENERGEVLLYYINEKDGMFYASETAMTLEGQLEIALSHYRPNGAAFAFEQGEGYRHADPYTLILPQSIRPMDYEGTNPLQNNSVLEDLLRKTGFNPYTTAVYTVADGQAIREGESTLRIGNNGTVVYHDGAQGDNARLTVTAQTDTPSEAEMIEAARQLVESTIGEVCGEANLYLMRIETQEDHTHAIYFGYHLNGAAVLLYDEGYAARVVVDGQRILEFTLCYRAYRAMESYTIVLPELQAVAAMDILAKTRSELLLCYDDNGGSAVQAGWRAQ